MFRNMNKQEFEELFQILDEYVKANVNDHRYRHTLGVVRAAEYYAKKYGADVYKAKLAAIFHDACKNDVAGLEHGEAAAKLLEEKFGVKDEEILLAIRNHTLGRIEPCLLEKVIKLADLLEDTRTYEDVPMYRAMEEETSDIDLVYLELLKRQRNFLIQKGIEYDKRTDEIIAYMEGKRQMTNRDIALFIASELDKRKAQDITIIDIAEKSGFADFFVIATASSLRQLQALSNYTEDKLAEIGIIPRHIEGKGDCGWILMDYNDVIVNLFTAEQRDHYNIEKIWNDCIRVDFEPEKEQ